MTTSSIFFPTVFRLKFAFSKALLSLMAISMVAIGIVVPTTPAFAVTPASPHGTHAPWHRGGVAKTTVTRQAATTGPVLIPVSQNQIGWLALSSIGAVEPFNLQTGQLLGSPIYLPTGLVPTAMAFWQPSPLASASPTDDPMLLVVSVKTLSLGGTLATSVATNTANDIAVALSVRSA